MLLTSFYGQIWRRMQKAWRSVRVFSVLTTSWRRPRSRIKTCRPPALNPLLRSRAVASLVTSWYQHSTISLNHVNEAIRESFHFDMTAPVKRRSGGLSSSPYSSYLVKLQLFELSKDAVVGFQAQHCRGELDEIYGGSSSSACSAMVVRAPRRAQPPPWDMSSNLPPCRTQLISPKSRPSSPQISTIISANLRWFSLRVVIYKSSIASAIKYHEFSHWILVFM